MSTISTPSRRYHHEADIPMSEPASEATVPSAANVIAEPPAKVRDRSNARFASLWEAPPT